MNEIEKAYQVIIENQISIYAKLCGISREKASIKLQQERTPKQPQSGSPKTFVTGKNISKHGW
jgi:hypothetical protein